jgi:hypothetical protein
MRYINVMRSLSLLFLALLLCHPSPAETRKWQSKDGSKFIIAEYIKHDALTVTVKRADGKIVTLGRRDLHEQDVNFLATLPEGKEKEKSSSGGAEKQQAGAVMEETAVFDTLKLGDSRADVQAKIKASKLLELTVDEMYLGRFGLNGSYRTKQTIGGLKCSLYFDWDGNGLLKELTLQTTPQSSSSYNDSLKDTWAELAKLMTTLHGAPLQKADFPAANQLENDMSLSSHLWRLHGRGSALLGTSKSIDGYMVSVRFTTETIEPVITEK